MTVELVDHEEVLCEERCVWCDMAELVAHTVDGFCEFCGAAGHPCH
jgi:hypothetical protein